MHTGFLYKEKDRAIEESQKNSVYGQTQSQRRRIIFQLRTALGLTEFGRTDAEVALEHATEIANVIETTCVSSFRHRRMT